MQCSRCHGKSDKVEVRSNTPNGTVAGGLLPALLLLILICGFSAEVYPQGTIAGIVIDKETNETLVGASIIIDGTITGTITDFDGKYTLSNIPLGSHTIVCSFISYDKIEKQITVTNWDPLEVNFALSGSAHVLDEITITSRKNLESENLLILEQKHSILATQSIGAQELSRKGISDAEGAVTKISGISKQDGVKNVFVRGLGDRYNTTTLNGFILPSEDPEYKNISLDFFTSDMIQSVTVSKVFSASMTGDVGGALIDIKSKELVGDGEFEIGVSTSFNSVTVGKDIYLAEGMNSFGYSTASYGPYDNYSTDYSFNTSLDPVKVNSPFNYGISFSGGKKFLDKHRFFVAGSMDNKYRYEEGILRDITATDAANPFVDMLYTRYIRSSSNLLLGNLELNYTRAKLSYNSLYIHSGSVYHAELYGLNSDIFQIADEYGYQGLIRRQQINDNALFVNQFLLQGDLSERLTYFAGASINQLTGKEPDRRIFAFPSIGNDSIKLHHSESRNKRFNSELTEMSVVPKISLQYKLSNDSENSSRIEMGYDSRISYKEFTAPVYRHIVSYPQPEFERYHVLLDNYINQEGLTNGALELEHHNDNYDVVRIMHGAYIDLIYQLGSSVTLNAGLRSEYVFIKIDYNVNNGSGVGADTINGLFLSPSFNLKYVLNDKHHLRIGSSRTFTLPQDIEISPFVRDGFDGYEAGNAKLEVSTNYNLDLKWDYYISAGELLSITGFYKHIVDPIARLDMANSAGIRTFDNIGDYASAAGLEAELRKKLLSLANKHNFNMGINASYIHTRHHGLDKALFVQNVNSAMEGAAPYIVNADLTYNLVSGGFSMNSALVVNYLGDKIHTIGTRGFNTLYEESITTLDFVNTYKINNRIGIGFKAMNILDPEFKLTRKGSDSNVPSAVIRSYKKGVSFDLSIKYKF